MSTLELTPLAPTLVQVMTSVPEFAFQLELPTDWFEHPVVDDVPDFQDPAALQLIARFASADCRSGLTVAVRPSFLDGDLTRWLTWLGATQGMSLGEIAPLAVGPLMAASCLAAVDSEDGTLWLRVALCEDGQNLFLLSAAAPADLFDAVGPALTQVVTSFTLVAGRGQTAAVG